MFIKFVTVGLSCLGEQGCGLCTMNSYLIEHVFHLFAYLCVSADILFVRLTD